MTSKKVHFKLQNQNIIQKSRLRLACCPLACLVLLACLILSACGGKSGLADISFRGQVADLKTFPQNLSEFAQQAGGNKPLLTQAQQNEQASRYKTIFYRPWSMSKSTFSKKDAAWAVKNYRGKQSYTASGALMPPDTWIKGTDNANIKNFPSLAWRGIIVANAPLRALPTSTP